MPRYTHFFIPSKMVYEDNLQWRVTQQNCLENCQI